MSEREVLLDNFYTKREFQFVDSAMKSNGPAHTRPSEALNLDLKNDSSAYPKPPRINQSAAVSQHVYTNHQSLN